MGEGFEKTSELDEVLGISTMGISFASES